MFKSLKFKLLTFFLIANLIILLGFSTVIYYTAKKGVLDNTDTIMKIISLDIISDLKKESHLDLKKTVLEVIDEFKISPLEIKMIYYDKNKSKIVYQTLSSKNSQKLFEIPLNVMGYLYSIYYFDKKEYRVSSMQIFEDDNIKIIFQLAIKKVAKSPYLEQLYFTLMVSLPIILISLLFIANILIERTLSPVKDVISSVKLIGVHNLSQRIASDKIPTEIEALVEIFNQLLNTLEDSFTRISSFSSDASHELKTPLTVIRGEIEVALRKERSSQEYKAILNGLLQETIQVQQTIEQLFFITKKDSSEYLENHQEIYLDELLLDVVEQNRAFATHKSICLNMYNIIPISINANEALLKIALNNIVRNAIIYSESNSIVNIYMKESANSYFICIEDFGYGISQKDIVSIFERFYRVDRVRSRQNSGTGLGLAIVKMILDIHHYSIDVYSVLDKGTTITIQITK